MSENYKHIDSLYYFISDCETFFTYVIYINILLERQYIDTKQ